MPDGWDIDLCDYGLCYVGIPAGGTMNPVSGSTQAYLKLIVQPDTIAGAGWLWFQVYEVGNNSNFVDVYFSLHTPGTSGTASPGQSAGLRIFPNPALPHRPKPCIAPPRPTPAAPSHRLRHVSQDP